MGQMADGRVLYEGVRGLARPERDEAVGHGQALLFLVYGGNSWGFFERYMC